MSFSFTGAAFLDIGANSGIYTVSAALLGRKVFAFEPLLPTLNALKHNVIINNLTDKVHIYNYGLLEKEKCVTSTIDENRSNIGRSSLLEDKYCSEHSEIKISTLDRFLFTLIRMKINQVIIKIDIEESEPYAVLGGMKFFEKIDVPFIQMEIVRLNAVLRSTNPKNWEKKQIIWKSLFYLNTKFTPLAPDASQLNVLDADIWKYLDIIWVSRKHKSDATENKIF